MTNEKITKILDLHYINYRVSNNEIWVVESYTMNGKYHEDLVNVTGWTKKQLLDWLGY